MSDVLTAHLDAIDANLALLKTQTAAMRQAIASSAPKVDAQRLPRCQDIKPALCAIANDEMRMDKRTFGNPHAWECQSCGHLEAAG